MLTACFTVDAADLPEEALADNRKTQKVIKKIPSSAIENCKGIAVSLVVARPSEMAP